jgi:hypothetical protein
LGYEDVVFGGVLDNDIEKKDKEDNPNPDPNVLNQ